MIISKIIQDNREKITISNLTDKIKSEESINECGAIFTFEGIVRGEESAKSTEKILLTTPDIKKTEKELDKILNEVQGKYGVKSVAVVHYLGKFEPGDPMFLAVVAGPHRQETRSALEDVVERVKFELDFKKEEFGSAGSTIIMSGG